MKAFRFLIAVVMLPAFLVACNNGEQSKTTDAQPTEQVKEKEAFLPPAPKTFEEIMAQNPGKYAGDKYNKEAVEQELSKMPKAYAKDANKVYAYLHTLVAENYQPRYQEFIAFDPNYSINKATPDGTIKIPKLEKINVEIILDASGSMAGQVNGGQKMDLAKQAIRGFVSNLPKEAKVSLRVYGHKGSNKSQDKQISCQSSELVYPLHTYDQTKFEKALDQFQPTGWTPLARGIEEAKKDLETEKGEGIRNIIYVVSDGIETCGGDPVQAAKQLKDSGIEPLINIVGFDVDDAGQKQLKQVAEAADGVYKSVYSETDLKEFMEAEKKRIEREWDNWALNSRFEAKKGWAEKKGELQNLYGDLTDLIPQETKRMFDANDYLENKGLITSEVNSDVTRLILDRNRLMKDKTRSRYTKISEALRKIEDNIKEDVNQTREQNRSN
ncbi:vWA domain-containing protein [Laceyella tengchongensis]